MKPIKLALLWHQHQPYYKLDDEYQLPWVRLHAIKDYLDLGLYLYDYPNLKQTFNLVPSLMMQIEDYANETAIEKVLELTKIPAANLSDADKTDILKSFFICNEKNMILPYSRFNELFRRYKQKNGEDYSAQDWLDLQVWYNLTWFGPISRNQSELKYLFAKGRNFTEDDKILMLNAQTKVLKEIVPTFKRLLELNQIELSVSPMFHPILPLLCNTDIASESMEGITLLENSFKYPQDAEYHIDNSVKYFESLFGVKPAGMWPSEGSVSDESLNLIAKAGFKWIATDEQILMNSADQSINRLERFFPRKFVQNESEINVFFREHFLSDMIGFQYSSWEPNAAALDFINRIKYVRWELTSKYGEGCLDTAVLPIILDGENCWEFYYDNGKQFLDELYKLLSSEKEIQTVTFSEAIQYDKFNSVELKHIRAGSWIDGNFNVWIGQDEHIKAWSALKDARDVVERNKNNVTIEVLDKAMQTLYIAEGSDWFWWYSDAHQAPNKYDFDIMFRQHLKNVYMIINRDYPDYLYFPFSSPKNILTAKTPDDKISPSLDPIINEEWEKAGFFLTTMTMDSMHSGGNIISAISYCNDDRNLYLKIDLNRQLTENDTLTIQFSEGKLLTLIMNKISSDQKDFSLKILDKYLMLSIPLLQTGKNPEIKIISVTCTGVSNYPREGSYELKLIL